MKYLNYEGKKSINHQKKNLLLFINDSFICSTLNFLASKSNLKQQEKYILLLIALCFIIFCIGGFFFLPELKTSRQFSFKHFRSTKSNLTDLLQFQHNTTQFQKKIYLIGEKKSRIIDFKRFNEKVENENNDNNDIFLPKPEFSLNKNQKNFSDIENARIKPEFLPVGEDKDPEIRNRRDVVKEMMLHAWNNYVKYAWGSNELKPISKVGHSPGIFGSTKLGASIIDGIGTLYIMGLKNDFEKARDFIEKELNLKNIDSFISVFEINIRFIGGLLSVYALTGDKLFLDKAESFAKILLPVFDTKFGIPWALINPKTGAFKNYIWASGSSILSEFGTLHLEFTYLSHVTKNPIYKEKVKKIRNYLQKIDKIDGLYYNYLDPLTGRWGLNHASIGGLGDSFYEYLLKSWLQSNRKDNQARMMYAVSMNSVFKNLLRTSKSGLMYFGNLVDGRFENKMEHLTCFVGGLIALGSVTLFKGNEREKHLSIAANVTNTCHKSYIYSATKLGPDSFYFYDKIEAKSVRLSDRAYLLRPEVIESYFYMWRLTKDKKYRDWAWNATQAINLYCRVKNGFSGIKNVYTENSLKDDVQQSYFFAETLKYLYLIFSDDSLIPFDKWVFNSEGHPLPIAENNSIYVF